MLPGTTELLIIMELMATSVSDLVSPLTLVRQHVVPLTHSSLRMLSMSALLELC